MEIPKKYQENLKSLEKSLKDVFEEVGIPLMALDSTRKSLTQEVLWVNLEKTKDYGKYAQAMHNILIPLINNEVLERAFRLTPNERREPCIAAVSHDIERIEYPETVDKKGHLTPEDWEKVRHHPTRARELLIKIGEKKAANIAGLHHAWQTDNYPNPIDFEYTPEEEFFSKILSIVDFYHRASISTNGRVPRPNFEKYFIDLIYRGGRASPERVEEALIKQYGNMELKLEKRIRTNGNHLIGTLYDLGVFGADNPAEKYILRGKRK